MGILSDLLTSPKTFASGTGLPNRQVYRKLRGILTRQGDYEYPTSCDVKNEVQTITAITGGVNGGTYTLTFTLFGGQAFTTGNIAYNANAGTITTAINTAATSASVPGWTNGDIVVTGGPLSTTTTTFTFSGASVAGANHGQTTQNGALLTVDASPGGAVGTAATTTHGQAKRSAWATLLQFGVISSDPPAQGADATSVTSILDHANYPHTLRAPDIKALIDEASYQDANLAVKTKLLQACGF